MMRHHGTHETFWTSPAGGPAKGRHMGFGPGGRGRPGGPYGPRGGRRGGRPRGDVRVAILLLLEEQPRHGYDLMRAIEERTDGAWSPSPGSVYPTLQALQDEGLVDVTDVDGRRTAALTDAGRAWLEEHAEEASSVFEPDAFAGGAAAIRREMLALGDAAMHVARQANGTEMAAQAAAALAAARKEIYRLLADDER